MPPCHVASPSDASAAPPALLGTAALADESRGAVPDGIHEFFIGEALTVNIIQGLLSAPSSYDSDTGVLQAPSCYDVVGGTTDDEVDILSPRPCYNMLAVWPPDLVSCDASGDGDRYERPRGIVQRSARESRRQQRFGVRR